MKGKIMYCPKCKTEYRAGFTTCSDCGVLLVQEIQEESKELSSNDNRKNRQTPFSNSLTSALTGAIIWGILSLCTLLLFSSYIRVGGVHLFLTVALEDALHLNGIFGATISLLIGFIAVDAFVGLLIGFANNRLYQITKSKKLYYLLYVITFFLYWLAFSYNKWWAL